MKTLKKSFVMKVMIHVLMFILGCIIIISAGNFTKYINTYTNKTTSFYETDYFHAKYLKYIERVAEYIQYVEKGYKVDSNQVYENSYIDSITSMEDTIDNMKSYNTNDFSLVTINNKYSDQATFEFYHYKLNVQDTNFIYYVKNVKTGKIYHSPYLDKIAKNDKTLNNFLKKIDKNKAYLVLNTKSAQYGTNLDSSKGYLSSDNMRWVIQCMTGNLNTNEKITSNTDNQYIVYTSLLDNMPYNDEFHEHYIAFENMYHSYLISMYLLPVCVMLFSILFIISLYLCGYSKKWNGIGTYSIDRVYTDLLLLLTVSSIIVLFRYIIHPNFLLLFKKLNFDYRMISLGDYTVLYILIMPILYSMIRKLKNNTLFTNTLLYKVMTKISQTFKMFFENRSMTYRTMLLIIVFILVQIVAFVLFLEGGLVNTVSFYVLIISTYLVTTASLIKKAAQFHIIITETKKITDGDLNHKIDETSLDHSIKLLGSYINRIGDGLSAAVEEKIKSERLKTELITNVSHDIKTPLTSIINYVDLLKKEKFDNETASNYLEILETKSWRLKTLIEDLVEASKASSGTINLNLEKLNIVELIRQSAGEFEDRLSERKLETILNISEEPIYILADGRSTFRIIENIFSNVNKYALSGTRVYIDVIKSDTKVSVSVKNVSANKLNIDSNELMERFVRGDISRNTEGSGLGLSISKSLAALQNATFDIILDGDLFKAVVSFTTID